ncbi:Zinc finger protein 782 [Eumeta japonica]|uniref:Zinc finger protein 782 n=1 Tax=Eumeta variegata TaxID=151549 RepID=A0A4C1XTF6_EUMVA|nr:Zinc finger protein 782 [Eumeta japonica]
MLPEEDTKKKPLQACPGQSYRTWLEYVCEEAETNRKTSGEAIKRGSFETYWSGVVQSQRVLGQSERALRTNVEGYGKKSCGADVLLDVRRTSTAHGILQKQPPDCSKSPNGCEGDANEKNLYKYIQCECTTSDIKMKLHILTHTDKNPYEFKYCECSGSQLGTLKLRTYTHIADKPYKCVQCEYSSSRFGDMKRHMHTHTGEKPYKCEQCKYSASDLGSLKRHKRTHTGEKPYKCEQCEYSASQPCTLKLHMRTHMEDKPYKCEQCDYSASQLSNLKTHMLTHMGEKPYKCEQCEYNSIRFGDMKRHMGTHTGEKPYKCDQCEYSASQLANLKLHIRTHVEDKPYKCEQCKYSASQLSNLKTHMRTHTGEKPYKCDQCEYSASQLVNLKSHMRTHVDKNPYKCKQCEFSDSDLSSLKLHMRTHTGDKPYKCVQCKYSASQIGSLKLHMRTHTGDKPYKCEQCEYRASRLASNPGNINPRHLKELSTLSAGDKGPVRQRLLQAVNRLIDFLFSGRFNAIVCPSGVLVPNSARARRVAASNAHRSVQFLHQVISKLNAHISLRSQEREKMSLMVIKTEYDAEDSVTTQGLLAAVSQLREDPVADTSMLVKQCINDQAKGSGCPWHLHGMQAEYEFFTFKTDPALQRQQIRGGRDRRRHARQDNCCEESLRLVWRRRSAGRGGLNGARKILRKWLCDKSPIGCEGDANKMNVNVSKDHSNMHNVNMLHLEIRTHKTHSICTRDINHVNVTNVNTVHLNETLLSRASQDDGWLAPCRMHHSHCILWVVHPLHITTLQDTEQPSPQLTPARRSSKWDAAERHQSSDVHHTNWLVRTRRSLILPRGHEYRGDDESTISTMSPSAGARHIGSRARRGTRVGSILSTTSARSDRRGADTCASLQARGARCRQSGPLRQRRRSARSGSG